MMKPDMVKVLDAMHDFKTKKTRVEELLPGMSTGVFSSQSIAVSSTPLSVFGVKLNNTPV